MKISVFILVKVKNNIVSIDGYCRIVPEIFSLFVFIKNIFGMSLGGRIKGNIKWDHHSERKTQYFIQCHVGLSITESGIRRNRGHGIIKLVSSHTGCENHNFRYL